MGRHASPLTGPRKPGVRAPRHAEADQGLQWTKVSPGQDACRACDRRHASPAGRSPQCRPPFSPHQRAPPRGSMCRKFGTSVQHGAEYRGLIAWGFITRCSSRRAGSTPVAVAALTADSWVARIGGWGVNAASWRTRSSARTAREHALSGQACGTNGGIVGPMIYLLPLLIAYTGGKCMTSAAAWSGHRDDGCHHGNEHPDVHGCDGHGPARRLVDDIDAIWSQDPSRVRDARTLRRDLHPRRFLRRRPEVSHHALSPMSPDRSSRPSSTGVTRSSSNRPRCSSSTTPSTTASSPRRHRPGLRPGRESILFLLEANLGLGLLSRTRSSDAHGQGLAGARRSSTSSVASMRSTSRTSWPAEAHPAMIAGGMTQIFVNVLFHSGLQPGRTRSIIAVY